MRHPGNCVAKLVREFYEDSTGGGKLTDQRKEVINHWERSGGTIENIKELELLIKRAINVRDITDGNIFPGTNKYTKNGKS